VRSTSHHWAKDLELVMEHDGLKIQFIEAAADEHAEQAAQDEMAPTCGFASLRFPSVPAVSPPIVPQCDPTLTLSRHRGVAPRTATPGLQPVSKDPSLVSRRVVLQQLLTCDG